MIDERPTVSQLEDYQATNNIKKDIVEFAELEKRTVCRNELRRSNSRSSCNIPVNKNVLSTDSELIL